jgi:hypothetical protein
MAHGPCELGLYGHGITVKLNGPHARARLSLKALHPRKLGGTQCSTTFMSFRKAFSLARDNRSTPTNL